MKKAAVFLLAIILILGLSACGGYESETIEGYWMAENGETISFNSDGKAIIEGMSHDYSIYDNNKLSISFLGFAQEYEFTIKKDVLTLTDLNTNETYTYYKDEEKQAEIQENLNQIAVEKAEQEKAQKEQEEYDKYVNSLKSRLDAIDSKIPENEAWIVEVQSWIADIDSDIAEVQQSDDMLADEQIENLKDEQNRLYEDIAEIQQEIYDLQVEKEEIIKTLKELGEL